MTSLHPRLVALALALSPAFAGAAPKVAADIPAVHSLASAVMAGAGTPSLVMTPGASPHGYAMRPSEAAALAEADVVFWIGPALTPWLDRALETLGEGARSVELMEAEGVRLLALREGATFEAHRHEDEDDGHGDDHGHGESADHPAEAHTHDDNDHLGHAHEEGADPHLWLDPENGRAMAAAMAAALAEADPKSAALYRANAEAVAMRLDALEAELGAALAPLSGRPFVVFHDAYHYFEARFGVEAAGAVSVSDAAAPGPARIEEVRGLIGGAGAVCVFAEPQFDPKLVERLVEGTGAKIGRLDPHGVSLEPGAELYPRLLRDLAAGLTDCLGE